MPWVSCHDMRMAVNSISFYIVHFWNSGTFLPTYSYSRAVDFSTPILNDHWTIAIPITLRHDFLSFLYPLTFEVWMVIIVSVPTFILASMLTDYLYTRYRPFRTLSLLSEWQRSIAFIMRTIFVDNSFMYVKYEHKRICTCHHMAFVSICTHTSICRNVDSNDYKTRASEDNSKC